jgi:hypothetical protein
MGGAADEFLLKIAWDREWGDLNLCKECMRTRSKKSAVWATTDTGKFRERR